MTKNYQFLFDYLKKEQITIDQNEFVFQLKSHPETDSLLAISDTFSFFGIKNIATQISNEDLVHLPDRFIALIKEESTPFLAFIERVEIGFRYTHKVKPITIAHEKFETMFQNIVLIAEQEETESKVIKNNKRDLILTIVLVLVYLVTVFINGFSWLLFVLISLLAFGVYLSVESLSHEFGIKTTRS